MNEFVSRALMLATILLILLMPVASGMRGFSEPLGRVMLAGCDAWLIAMFALSVPYARARFVMIVTILLISVSAAFMIFDGHFPPFLTSYQGFRKSLLWLFAIVIGSSLRERAIKPICTTVVIVLTLICLYGVKQYFVQSEFDARLLSAQSASIYANKIGQSIRATSVLSSGFHLGMAGCVLICLIIYARNFSILLRLFIVTIAFFAIYASLTRTFLIVAIAILALRFAADSSRRLVPAVLISLFTGTVLIFFDIDLIGAGITAAANDTRFAGRSESYREFFHYLGLDPIAWMIGFGPGTAGSTLGQQYLSYHVPWIEPHNIFTKYIFEFGLPLTILIYFSVVHFTIGTRRQSTRYSASSARMMLFVLFLSGLTITSVETWPVSIYIGFLIGLMCSSSVGAQDLSPSTSGA